MNQDTLLFGTALLAGSFFLINNSMKNKREGFRALEDELTGGRNGGAQAVMSNPGNFPSTPSVRSDVNGTLQGGLRATAPGQLSAAGASFTNTSGSPIDYKSVGSYTQDTLLRNNNLTSEQVAQALKDVYGGKTPDLQSARDLLPIPDMKYTSSIDPTNPENFIYNRTLFARLKRRYGKAISMLNQNTEDGLISDHLQITIWYKVISINTLISNKKLISRILSLLVILLFLILQKVKSIHLVNSISLKV